MAHTPLQNRKRFQYATQGVHGTTSSRRQWMSRQGFWRFLEIAVDTGDKVGLYYEPTTIESLDKIISIKLRYKGKIWDKVYYITPSKPILVVANLITKFFTSAKARLKGVDIDNNEITITVRKKYK